MCAQQAAASMYVRMPFIFVTKAGGEKRKEKLQESRDDRCSHLLVHSHMRGLVEHLIDRASRTYWLAAIQTSYGRCMPSTREGCNYSF